MTELHLVDEEPPATPASRLLEHGVAWHEAQEIAEAYRVRVQRTVLEAIDAGMSTTEASRLTGISRVTINTWRRHGGPRRRTPSAIVE